jgi:hypothetical protein
MADRNGDLIPAGEEVRPDEKTMDRQQAIDAAADWLTEQGSCNPTSAAPARAA